MPDLVVMGSNDIALDIVVGKLAEQGLTSRVIAVGSLGGVAAAERGECDLAPVHLIDPATGVYNKHLLQPGLSLVKGWQRMQGFVFRKGDARFEGRTAAEAVTAALADAQLPDGQPQCRRRHPRADRQAARRQAPARLFEPAALAQRGRRGGGARPRRLGRRHVVGGGTLRPRVPVRSRRRTTISWWWRAAASRPAVQAFLAALRDEARARRKSRRSACAPPMPDFLLQSR